MTDLDSARGRGCAGIPHRGPSDAGAQKSRDFFWYSPVLKRQLDARHRRLRGLAARARPRSSRVLAACHALGVPGHAARRGHRQLRPGDAARRGGVMLDLADMTKVKVDRPRPRRRRGRRLLACDRPGDASRSRGRSSGSTPRPHRPPRSAASSPAARAASARSSGAACAISATSSASASSPWRPSRAFST